MSMDHVISAAAVTAPNAATLAVTSGAITIAGIATGLSYDVLMAGFAGALCSVSFLGPMRKVLLLWSVFTSTLFAAYMGPVVIGLIEALIRKFVDLPPEPVAMRLATAYLCGIVAQIFIPLFQEWVHRRGVKEINEVSE